MEQRTKWNYCGTGRGENCVHFNRKTKSRKYFTFNLKWYILSHFLRLLFSTLSLRLYRVRCWCREAIRWTNISNSIHLLEISSSILRLEKCALSSASIRKTLKFSVHTKYESSDSFHLWLRRICIFLSIAKIFAFTKRPHDSRGKLKLITITIVKFDAMNGGTMKWSSAVNLLKCRQWKTLRLNITIWYDIHGNPGQLNSSNSSEFLNTKNISIFAHIPYLICNGTALFKCIFVLWVVAVACIAVRMVKTETCFLFCCCCCWKKAIISFVRCSFVCFVCNIFIAFRIYLFSSFFAHFGCCSVVRFHTQHLNTKRDNWMNIFSWSRIHTQFFFPRLADSRLFRVHVLYNICISCLLLYRFIWCI